MKKLLLFALLVFSLSNCAGPPPPEEVVRLDHQAVTITKINTGKHARVHFAYKLQLEDGQTLTLYGRNSERSRRKKYNLHVGQTVETPVELYTHNDGVFVNDIDFSAYQK